jgi:ethanolamine ammonia-lyase large subunit
MQAADLTLREVVSRPLIDASDDDVTRLIVETFDQEAFRSIQSMTVGEFRDFVLDDGRLDLQRLRRAIFPDIAAIAKLMSNKDIVPAAAKIRNVTRCRNTMGERGVSGIRTQPI